MPAMTDSMPFFSMVRRPLVQIRQEAAALLVVGVGDAVADSNALARDFADAAHKNPRESVG
jgi:hypothetical protein